MGLGADDFDTNGKWTQLLSLTHLQIELSDSDPPPKAVCLQAWI